MVTAPPRPKPEKGRQTKPWLAYEMDSKYLLLEPGWGGNLDDEELACIQEKLKTDLDLAYWWGFRPGQKTRPEAAIRRVAMDGDPDHRQSNKKLARVRREMPDPAHEGSLAAMRKHIGEGEWSSGAPAQLEMAFSN